MMDPNRNRTAAAVDALGMVVGTAVMGKPLPAPVEGDTLTGFDPDPTDAAILNHLANPFSNPQGILQRASTRLIYDVFAYQRTKSQPDPQPAVVYTMARKTHDSDPVPAGGLKIQHDFSFSDGFGREIQKKIQAEPGPVPERDQDGKIILDASGQPEMTLNDVSPRWVGSAWTVFNNKGKPVRQYEPFFTDTHRFEFDIRIGVSPVLFYDPLERAVATLHPNHSWDKLVFDPWRQTTWDVNDTVLIADPAVDPDVGKNFGRLPSNDYLPTWHAQRIGLPAVDLERDAAEKAAAHSDTPTIAHLDALGRAFLTLAHNRVICTNHPLDGTDEKFATRVELDIEGNQRSVLDALGRIVIRYEYGIAGPEKEKEAAGNRIHQASMEAGERWTLNDVSGKPIRAWDNRGHEFRSVYDQLQRPVESYLRQSTVPESMVGRTVYGETRPTPETDNLRGKVVQLFDQAGVVASDRYDFKGNSLRGSRQLAVEYKATLDWAGSVPLETEIYASQTRYDALNRPTELTTPDNSVIRPGYNEANLLETVEANLQGTPAITPFVNNIDYDAKGQRERIEYASGVRTDYAHDPLTFRLVHLLTSRNAAAFPADSPEPPPNGWPGSAVQNLHYTYDPAGNITHIRDDAQQIVYFRNKRVEPSADYTYDSIYRLIEATGREHLGQAGAAPAPSSYNDEPRVGILLSASDGNAMGLYLQRYVYDAVGNFQQMIHLGTDPANPGWTRNYAYNEASLLDPAKQSNRLTSTTVGTTAETYSTAGNGYDAHGNMLRMPQLQVMQWDFKDQLQMTQRQAVNASDQDGVERQGERTWYVYDASGQRVRKVTELASGQVKDERIYLGGFEIYRRRSVNPLVRETLHIMDDKKCIALVETRTQGSDAAPQQLIRYQFSNHLDSASLELDEQAQIITYEEYYPYGSTSYQAVRSQAETPKRYRYTRKERDDETGLAYHETRYYAAWLGRWVSCDPAGVRDGVNIVAYSHCNPLKFVDPSGTQAKKSDTDPPTGAQNGIEFLSSKEAGEKWSTLDLETQGIQLECVSIFADSSSVEASNPEATVFGGNLPELVIRPEAVFLAFIGGAADARPFWFWKPTHIMKDVKTRFLWELSTNTSNTDFFRARYYGYEDVDLGNVQAGIDSARAANPQVNIYIVGHSLGAWEGAALTSQEGYHAKMFISLDPVGTRYRYTGDISFAEPSVSADTWINILAQPKQSDRSDTIADWGKRAGLKGNPARRDTANFHHAEALELMKYQPSYPGRSAWDLLQNQIENKLRWLMYPKSK